MNRMENEKKLKELAKELAKGLKTEKDLSTLSRALLKLSIETALGAKMEAHLGYEPHAVSGRNSGITEMDILKSDSRATLEK